MLRYASIAELGMALRRRNVSSVELTRQALDLLDSEGRALNVVAQLIVEPALEEARRADAELRRDHDRGPLHGIPYGVKDLVATAGIPTRWGAAPYRHQVPTRDATVVERLRGAGAVLVGKLAMVALAGAGLYRSTAASLDGACRNPWDRSRWSGGSSSGCAAAVAAGLLPFAIGSETRGSIVVPSAFCGITGLRPTYGLVSRDGVMKAAWSMDKLGPMARTAEDCATVLSRIAGPDPRDPTTRSRRPPGRLRQRTRVGVLPYGAEAVPKTRFEDALGVLRAIGSDLLEVPLTIDAYTAVSQTIVAVETAAAHENLIRSPDLDELSDPAQRDGLRSYLAVPAAEYARALELRVARSRALDRIFDEVDLLVAPTVPFEAPPLDVDLATVPRLGYAVLGAVAGVPGLSVPIGPGAHGLPLGLSMIAQRGHDGWVAAMGKRFQRETGWHEARPT